MTFRYISSLPHDSNEDKIQEAWLKALEKTEDRPQATTPDELHEKYQHIAGLVTHIYRHEKVNEYRARKHESLTFDIPVWYNDDNPFEECTPEQIEAITYYLEVTQTGKKLNDSQKSKLKRLRKKTGLALRVDEHYDKGESVNATT